MEREISGPVDLCDERGRLNPDARGWSRQPALRANLSRAYGRKKRWDYWCVIAPDVIVSFVYADIDYAGLLETALRIHPRTRAVKTYDVSDGLQGNEFNGGAA